MEIQTEARDLDETLKNKIAPLKDYSGMMIETDDEAAFAGEIVQQIKDYEKAVVDFFEEDKKLASKLHKNICAKEKAALAPAIEIRAQITGKINAFLTDKRRKEEAARAEAERIRREQEAAERERLAKEAEAKRLEAEEAAKSGNEEQAQELAAQAEQIALESETVVVVPEVMPEVSKSIDTAAGKVSGRSDIDLEVIDKKALIADLVAKGLDGFIDIDLGKLKRFCKDTQGQFVGLKITESVKASFRRTA